MQTKANNANESTREKEENNHPFAIRPMQETCPVIVDRLGRRRRWCWLARVSESCQGGPINSFSRVSNPLVVPEHGGGVRDPYYRLTGGNRFVRLWGSSLAKQFCTALYRNPPYSGTATRTVQGNPCLSPKR